MLEYILKMQGSKRVTLGSDYPFPLGEKTPGQMIQNLDVSEAIKQRMLAGTTLEWLGPNEQDYIN